MGTRTVIIHFEALVRPPSSECKLLQGSGWEYRVSLSEDGNDTIRAKKRTLLALALTHPKLTDIALDEYWESMISLKPVANVVNHEYNVDRNKEHIMSRMSHYLARTQVFRLHVTECCLGQTLAMLRPSGLLCPNLQELSIDVTGLEIWETYQVVPFLASSSSLGSITLYDPDPHPRSEVATGIILDAFILRKADTS